MAIIATAGSGTNYTPAPAGVHQAVCVDVIDKGMVETKGFDGGAPKKKHMISVAWQINEPRDDGKRHVIYRRYTLSLNEKASLRRDLESWRGRPFTREEEMGFDVEKLIGANCLLNVTHKQAGDRTYANVVSIMPLVKGMPKMEAAGYSRDAEDAQHATHNGNGESADHDEPPPLTDDDIPFAWLMPLVLPALGLMGMLA
jgi:hypothetical protein